MNEEQEAIFEFSGMKPVSCSCDKCVSMCKRASCIGTPSETLRLINNGYKDRLTMTFWRGGIEYGMMPVLLARPKFENGQCTFLTPDGKCELHDLGLKPSDGTFADCKVSELPPGKYPPVFIITAMWLYPENTTIVAKVIHAIQK